MIQIFNDEGQIYRQLANFMNRSFGGWTALEINFLSTDQRDIYDMKASGKTIKEIRQKHNVNEQSQLSAICYTTRGLK